MKLGPWLLSAALTTAMMAGARSGYAQQTGLPGGFPSTGTSTNTRPSRPGSGDGTGIPPATAEKMEQARINERQKLLVADTDKLLELATELKAEVDKTDKNVLSVDVVKRAEQIEKLARSVKERMKGQR
jgi:hypothetical protein